MAGSTAETATIRTKGAMWRYCVQNIVAQMAFCPAMMASAYMIGRGMSSTLTGVAVALGNILALAIQPWIGSTADSKRGPTVAHMSILASIGCAVACLGALLPQPALVTLFVAVIFMLFQNLLSLINSVAVYYQNRGASINYGVARGLGSASFAGVSAVIGYAADAFGPTVYMLLGSALCLVTALVMLLLPTPKSVPELHEAAAEAPEADGGDEKSGNGSYLGFLKTHRRFMLLFFGLSLAVVVGCAAGTYALPLVRSVGGGNTEMGLAMALQAIVEVPGMWSYDLLERRFKTSALLSFAIAMYAVKGVLFFLASNLAMVYVAYTFQLLSFAIATPAQISYVNKHFGAGDKNKAVGLLSLIFSVANVITGPVVGTAIDAWGAHVAMGIAAAIGIAGALTAFRGIEPDAAPAAANGKAA